jgi:hypothetical protein
MMTQEVKERQERLEALCHSIFYASEHGRELLALLKEAYIMRTPVADMKNGEHWPYFREGQNSIIRQLEFWAEKEVIKCKLAKAAKQ